MTRREFYHMKDNILMKDRIRINQLALRAIKSDNKLLRNLNIKSFQTSDNCSANCFDKAHKKKIKDVKV